MIIVESVTYSSAINKYVVKVSGIGKNYCTNLPPYKAGDEIVSLAHFYKTMDSLDQNMPL